MKSERCAGGIDMCVLLGSFAVSHQMVERQEPRVISVCKSKGKGKVR